MASNIKGVDLFTGSARIRLALENLHHVWQDAADRWNDPVSRAFLEQHIEPLLPVVKNALDAVGRMQMLLDQAQRDCEE
jgi:hypothetical protein